MNRLRILLITTALITGGSALASAQDYRHHDEGNYRYQTNDRNYGRNTNVWRGDGDGDRDDQYVYRNGGYGSYGRPVYRQDRNDRDDRDNRWQNRRVFEHNDRDGDRR